MPPPGPFSRAVVHGGVVHVSGIGAHQDAVQRSVAEETTGALENVETVLHAAGSDACHIISASMLITNRQDYAECNKAYSNFFRSRGAANLPARTTALWGVPTESRVAFGVVASVVNEPA